MREDPIVREVRKIRQTNAEKFNYNIKKIVEDARERQRISKHRVVSFVVKKEGPHNKSFERIA